MFTVLFSRRPHHHDNHKQSQLPQHSLNKRVCRGCLMTDLRGFYFILFYFLIIFTVPYFKFTELKACTQIGQCPNEVCPSGVAVGSCPRWRPVRACADQFCHGSGTVADRVATLWTNRNVRLCSAG